MRVLTGQELDRYSACGQDLRLSSKLENIWVRRYESRNSLMLWSQCKVRLSVFDTLRRCEDQILE